MTSDAKPLGASIKSSSQTALPMASGSSRRPTGPGKALMAPRTRYKELRERLDGPGVYLLIGPTESGVPPHRVYVGETDDLRSRLDGHSAKDFWNRAIVFTNKGRQPQ